MCGTGVLEVHIQNSRCWAHEGRAGVSCTNTRSSNPVRSNGGRCEARFNCTRRAPPPQVRAEAQMRQELSSCARSRKPIAALSTRPPRLHAESRSLCIGLQLSKVEAIEGDLTVLVTIAARRFYHETDHTVSQTVDN